MNVQSENEEGDDDAISNCEEEELEAMDADGFTIAGLLSLEMRQVIVEYSNRGLFQQHTQIEVL